MFEIEESTTPIPFDPDQVDAASDADLDALDFGVIGLDSEGTILRYNLFESRLARLDRNQVLGRNFFHEVAPCTRGEAFEGRFRRFVQALDEQRSERFPFVFDFAFGAQEVVVQVVRAKGASRFYLLVKRRSAGAPRPGIAAAELAVEQRVLAPDEASFGVRRDEVEMRVVRVPWSFFAALRSTCQRLAPGAWPLLCHDWGTQWGRRAAVDLESTALERHAKSLRELSMRLVAELVSEHLQDQGWGRAGFDFSPASVGIVTIEMERSALAESTRLTRPRNDDEVLSPDTFACHLLAGCLGALLTHVAQRKLAVREIACASHGHAGHNGPNQPMVCTFVAVGDRRRKALEAALVAGARDVDAVRDALARPMESEA